MPADTVPASGEPPLLAPDFVALAPRSGSSATSLVARCDFPPAGTPVTCAVSGGADSLALLVLAVAAGLEVTAVHVDHGLRPGSAADAEVVRAAAARFGAGFRAVRVDVGAGPNLEARAREARYAALPADVCTGHTADDQAETVLLNLLRGAGATGLAGMRPGPRHPLLGLRRAETVALGAALGLDPVDDPTNADPRFRRNRVRHELLPLLDDVAGRDVVPVLCRQADLLRDEADLLAALATELDVTDARSVREAPVVLARLAVRAWLRAGPAVTHPPDAATVERVLAVARLEAGATDVGGGWRVTRSGGTLRLDPPATDQRAPDRRGPATRFPAPPHPHPPFRYVAGHADVTSHVPERSGLTCAAVASDDPHADDPNLGRVIVGEDELQERIAVLGKEITADFAGRAPLLVGVLKGAFMFMADLARCIDLPVEFDFMAVSSYGSSTRTSGVVRIVKDLDLDLTDRHVLLVEDIVDSGLTLRYLRQNLAARNPASLEVCALLVREGVDESARDLRYVGFHLPADFVVGYGLDVAERYRSLPYICAWEGGAV